MLPKHMTMHRIFAYGTLQIPEVMLAVTGKQFGTLPARLDGYSRHRLRGRSYPGIRPASGASVDGLLFLGVDAQTLLKLDEFEDPFYRRDSVGVSVDGHEWTAQAYVVRDESFGLLLPEEWCLEEFSRKHLALFLERHV